VLLFDEVEKAHREVTGALLSLLDEGRLDRRARARVDATHTVVVLTSNLGAELILARRAGTSRRCGSRCSRWRGWCCGRNW
jgi:ATP-dependent Clp protease ATP-binding subunit ClpC